ncbi:MAG: SRPBCC family protein [Paucibacter sp.]|nr:SRPBCC family protein [Roseateles sp.]
MKFVKGLLIAVVLLAAVLYGGAFLLPTTCLIERSQQMAAPPDKVYALIAAPKAWKRWSVWPRRDPAMQIDYSGPESGAGAGWTWKSKTEGDGSMVFTQATPPGLINYDLSFPGFGTSHGDFKIIPADGGSVVTWTMTMDMSGASPIWRWMGLFANKLFGKDFESGLAELKNAAEHG